MPEKTKLIYWIKYIFKKFKKKTNIIIRVVSIKEIKNLNQKYRGKNTPTNILSFPFINHPYKKSLLIGNLIICNKIMQIEAKKQRKEINEHWAHIIIHGGLHLMGYNHIKNKEANIMENLEIKILKKMGYKNPYIK
ncbi:rRNA maturation RNase YbeY [Buchnera aphidicola (Neophyllaphis podocarpi)]|uniref:rRNA maturation RNase YbeY n=1 Tax=Buchnera aphidicola TaxID=9 RepID=UPI0031B8AB2E